jgi:uncharacterized protein YkwD
MEAVTFAPSVDRGAKPSMEPPVPKLRSVESKIVDQTNAERARYGLRPLVLDDHLLESARKHAAWMTNRGLLQHTSLPVAENIAMGQRTCNEAVRDWMNSPGHRANILNPGYTRIGAAAFTAPNGTPFWCQQFTH